MGCQDVGSSWGGGSRSVYTITRITMMLEDTGDSKEE